MKRARRPRSVARLFAAGLLGVSSAGAAPAALVSEAPDGPFIALEPAPLAWIGVELEHTHLRLPTTGALPLLARYENPAVDRSGPWRSFWTGRYGPGSRRGSALSWSTTSCALPALPSAPWVDAVAPREWDAVPAPRTDLPVLARWLVPRDVPAPELLGLTPFVDCPAWQKRHAITFFRIDNERDEFHLLACDGSIAPEAVDRLSVMARPPGVPRPALPLPDEPDPSAAPGEWVPGVLLVHPRLVWAIAQIASAYPYRAVYVVSGYRPDSGTSFHARGRALDIQIVGVPNEVTLELCRALPDIACGYYPNNRFVHVDVRPPGTGHPVWIDVAEPSMPSQYVESWPGVVEGGGLLNAGEP